MIVQVIDVKTMESGWRSFTYMSVFLCNEIRTEDLWTGEDPWDLSTGGWTTNRGRKLPSGLSVVCLRHRLRHCLATDPWRHSFLWHHRHVTSSGRDVIDRSMTPHISCSYSSFADAISSAVVGQIFCPNIFYYLIFLLLSSPDLIGRVMEWWAGGRMSKTLCTYQWN